MNITTSDGGMHEFTTRPRETEGAVGVFFQHKHRPIKKTSPRSLLNSISPTFPVPPVHRLFMVHRSRHSAKTTAAAGAKSAGSRPLLPTAEATIASDTVRAYVTQHKGDDPNRGGDRMSLRTIPSSGPKFPLESQVGDDQSLTVT